MFRHILTLASFSILQIELDSPSFAGAVVGISTSFDSMLLSDLGASPSHSHFPKPYCLHELGSPPNFSTRSLHQGLHVRLWAWRCCGSRSAHGTECRPSVHRQLPPIPTSELHRLRLRILPTQHAGLWHQAEVKQCWALHGLTSVAGCTGYPELSGTANAHHHLKECQTSLRLFLGVNSQK